MIDNEVNDSHLAFFDFRDVEEISFESFESQSVISFKCNL